jgi:hypothetical protein
VFPIPAELGSSSAYDLSEAFIGIFGVIELTDRAALYALRQGLVDLHEDTSL